MPSPQTPASADRAGSVMNMLDSVDELGSNTERLFDRLYRGLRRKRRAWDEQTRLQVEQLQLLAESQSTDIARLTDVLAVINEGVRQTPRADRAHESAAREPLDRCACRGQRPGQDVRRRAQPDRADGEITPDRRSASRSTTAIGRVGDRGR